MRRKPEYLIFGLAAAIAGCSARAAEERQKADEPGEVRLQVDKESMRAFLEPSRQVHVTGTARVEVAPDVADLAIGVGTSRASAIEAVQANSSAMTDLIEAIKKRGVAAKDLRTSSLSITPAYSQPANANPNVPPEMTIPKAVGYDVSNTLNVTVRDLARVGELLDAALKAGSNQMHGLYFRIGDRDAVLAGLRIRAFDDARAKAEVYAQRAGMALGRVVQIGESDPGWMPSPMMGAPAPMMAAPMAPGAPMPPVNPGEQEVSLSVSVSYELRSPR